MHQFMLMLSRQTHVRISPEFPPREHLEPILNDQGGNSRSEGSAELETEQPMMKENMGVWRPSVAQGSNQIGPLMLQMEIPLFDG